MAVDAFKLSINREFYPYLAKTFLLANQWCAVAINQRATQIHHMRGRVGSLINDFRFFLPVCHEAHAKIESNATWSKKMGYTLPKDNKAYKVICYHWADRPSYKKFKDYIELLSDKNLKKKIHELIEYYETKPD